MNSSRWLLALVGIALIGMPQRLPAQSGCSSEIGEVREGLRAFDSVARQLTAGFPRADGLEAYLSGTPQGLDTQNRLREWTARLSDWEQGIVAYENCIKTTCRIDILIDGYKTTNPELASWLASIGNLGQSQATAETKKALSLLRDYASNAGSLAAGPMAAALTCLARNAVARPQAVPAKTVDNGGLTWKLRSIGVCKAGEPFRFSLCEGRYLDAGEASRPCNPSVPSTVTGGHNAPYVFSVGHNKFLPQGIGIDGNGVLHGDDCKLLKSGAQLPMCVRQLNVETCRAIDLGPKTTTAEAKAPEARKGGHAAVALLAVGAAAGGIAIGASALKTTDDTFATSSACVTRSQCCSGVGTSGGGVVVLGGSCGIPAQCACPSGLVDRGICQAGATCAKYQTPGLKECAGC